MGKNNIIVLEQKTIKSQAWLSLKGQALKVFLLFRTKCQCANVRAGSRKKLVITNNGEIEFTYDEALHKYNIKHQAFKNAIDELIEKGFIDIEEWGQGFCKLKTKYRISERWQKYGTDDFVVKKRPLKGIRRNGFQPGNELWKRRKKPNCDNTS